jgi:hypothetical protein
VIVMLRPTAAAITQQAADQQQARPQALSRDLEFRMSNEQCRREATRAVANVGGGSAFAFPIERVSSEEPLLLVLHADDEHLADAIDAVLSVDPEADAVLSRVLFADTMNTTPTKHTSEIVRLGPKHGYPTTEFRASCTTCSWIGPSRSTHKESQQDAVRHGRDRSPNPWGKLSSSGFSQGLASE